MYPAPSPLGDPNVVVATFVTSLDLVVGRYYYYYKVFFSPFFSLFITLIFFFFRLPERLRVLLRMWMMITQ